MASAQGSDPLRRPGTHRVFFFRDVEDAVVAAQAVVGPVLEEGGTAALFVERSVRRRLRPWLRRQVKGGPVRSWTRDAWWSLVLLRLRGMEEEKMAAFANRWLRQCRAGGNGQVAVVSQLGSTLLGQGKKDHAILFENVWTRCHEAEAFTMVCLYPLQDSEATEEAVVSVHQGRWRGGR